MAKRTQPSAEDASQEGRKLVQGPLDNFPAPIYAVDADGRFLLANKRLDRAARTGQLIRPSVQRARPSSLTEIDAEHRESDPKVIRSGSAIAFEGGNAEQDGSLAK